MYAAFYKLTTEPFQVTPDPRFLYPSASHKEAFASIVYGIEQRRGFIAVTGEVGTGKTTILRTYLEEADRARIIPIYLFNPDLTFDELVREVAAELHVLYAKASRNQIVSNIHSALINNYKIGKNVVLIIDEAQNMPVETLESLRMLSNIETTESKLLQIVLVGQPELAELLDRNELRQLKQRIAVRATIKPLTERESSEYIHSRLEQVAQDDDPVFTPAAIRKIVRYAGGIPRNINVACDSSLINGYGHRKRPVTVAIVNDALATFGKRSILRRFRWRQAATAASLLAIGAATLFYWPQLSSVMNVAYWDSATTTTEPAVAVADEAAVIVDYSEAVADEASVNVDHSEAVAGEAPVIVGYFESDKTSDLEPGALTKADNPASNLEYAAHGVGDKAADGPAQPEQVPTREQDIQAAATTEGPGFEMQADTDDQSVEYNLAGRAWNPAPLPESIFPVTRTILPGSVLSQHCLDIYGFVARDLFAYIAAENGIANADEINVGQTIVFPALTPQLRRSRSIYIQRKLRDESAALFSDASE